VVANGLDLLRLDRASSRLESIFIELARSGRDGSPADNSEGRPS
jgi:hypothetical protein